MSAAELLDKIDDLRKKNDAMRGAVAYLIGWHGEQARQSGNPELAELVGELRAVLDGSWVEPGSGQ